jgi:hypothetical protein
MDPGRINVQADQRLKALARARGIRRAQVELRRRIADGDVTAAEVILFHKRELESMPVADVLTSQRHWGHMRCRRFLTPMGVRETKTLGSMTERQRVALAARLSAAQPSASAIEKDGWRVNQAQESADAGHQHSSVAISRAESGRPAFGLGH